MLLVICGSIAFPSLVLAFFLTGWLQYVFVAIIAVNIAVPVMAYAASLNPPRAVPDDETSLSLRQQIVLEEAPLSVKDPLPAEKLTDKV